MLSLDVHILSRCVGLTHLAERQVDLPDGVVPGEPVVVEAVQVKHPRLQLVDGESWRGKVGNIRDCSRHGKNLDYIEVNSTPLNSYKCYDLM